jgi:hypothetical protein
MIMSRLPLLAALGGLVVGSTGSFGLSRLLYQPPAVVIREVDDQCAKYRARLEAQTFARPAPQDMPTPRNELRMPDNPPMPRGDRY